MYKNYNSVLRALHFLKTLNVIKFSQFCSGTAKDTHFVRPSNLSYAVCCFLKISLY